MGLHFNTDAKTDIIYNIHYVFDTLLRHYDIKQKKCIDKIYCIVQLNKNAK